MLQADELLPGGGIAADAAAHKRKYRLMVVQWRLPGASIDMAVYQRV